MLRSIASIAAPLGVSWLCLPTPAFAQGMRPAPQPVVSPKDGGTLDWATGTWRRGGAALANAVGAQVVYSNTCDGGFGTLYSPASSCWDVYEEGRIPGTDLSDPFLGTPGLDLTQISDTYTLCGFQFGYCTTEVLSAGGTVRLQVGFLEGPNVSGIGGDCMNVAQTLPATNPPSGGAAGLPLPPANFGGPRDLYFDIPGLLGSASATNASCWIITIDLTNNANGGFAFNANGGDGAYDGDDSDRFNILYGQRGTTATGSVGTGFWIAGGDPAQGGSGSLGVPTTGGCAVGLDYGNFSWINIDNSPVGTPPPIGGCSPSLPLGSNCYSFGGFPANPPADTYLTLWSLPTPSAETVYCTAKLSTNNCTASIFGQGIGPLISGANDWSVVLKAADANKPGIFFGSTTAQAAIPFLGGTLCVQPPLRRSPIEFSFGTFGQCDGGFSLLINDGVGFPLGFDAGPGGTSYMQAWLRDAPNTFGSTLSDGVQFDWQ